MGLRSSELSLEEIFLKLTKDDSAELPMTQQKQVEVKQTVAKILGDDMQPEVEKVPVDDVSEDAPAPDSDSEAPEDSKTEEQTNDGGEK